MDVDTTSGKWAHTEILDRVGRGEVDILLGTQMIAKGLDFPNVTLVGVIDADVGINLPGLSRERADLPAAQPGGRARRTRAEGRRGDHPDARADASRGAVRGDARLSRASCDEELAGARDPPYPPTMRLANVVLSGLNEDATAKLAQEAAEWLRALLASQSMDGCDGGRAGAVPGGADQEAVALAPVAQERRRRAR